MDDHQTAQAISALLSGVVGFHAAPRLNHIAMDARTRGADGGFARYQPRRTQPHSCERAAAGQRTPHA